MDYKLSSLYTIHIISSPPVPESNSKTEKELNFPMKITGDVVDAFEKARGEASLSRRSWVMLTIIEKLNREEHL
jgi:hypothetical protein